MNHALRLTLSLSLAAALMAPGTGSLSPFAATPAFADKGDKGDKDGGSDKGSDKGSEKGSDKGSDKGSGKGSDKSADRGAEKASKSAEKAERAAARDAVRNAVEVSSAASGTVEETGKTKGAKGKVASELKGLNAMHASPTALANAAPNSRVGRIAAYRAAALATSASLATSQEAEAELAAAQAGYDAALADLDALTTDYAGRSAAVIQADIDALDPAAPNYDSSAASLAAEMEEAQAHAAEVEAATADLAEAQAALSAEQAEYAALSGDVSALEAQEQAALMEATGGRILSDEAMDELRTALGL